MQIKIIFLLLFLFIYPLSAQNVKYVHKVVKELGTSSMFGRSAYKNGDSIAADYIAKEFAKHKLMPISQANGGDNKYYQQFNLSSTILEEVYLELNNKGNKLQPDVDYYILGYSPSAELELENAKPLIIDDKSHWNLIKNTKLSDVILVFNVQSFDMPVQEIYDFVDTSLSNVQPKLVIFQGYDKLSYYIGRAKTSKYPVIQLTKTPISAVIPYLKLHIKSSLSSEHKTQNVIGFVEGKQRDKYILISAHYDGLGMFGDIVFPGAQDNAIGVATLLDLASYFGSSANKPPYSLVFVAFAAEEIGMLGSKHFVNNPIVPLNNINLVLNLDLVGSGSQGLQFNNGNAPNTEEIYKMFEKINREELYFYKLVAGNHRCNSDHCAFAEANVPAMFLMTLGPEHSYSHSIYDSYENLPFTKYESLFKLIRDYIISL